MQKSFQRRTITKRMKHNNNHTKVYKRQKKFTIDLKMIQNPTLNLSSTTIENEEWSTTKNQIRDWSDKPVSMLATFNKRYFLQHNLIQANRTDPTMMNLLFTMHFLPLETHKRKSNFPTKKNLTHSKQKFPIFATFGRK